MEEVVLMAPTRPNEHATNIRDSRNWPGEPSSVRNVAALVTSTSVRTLILGIDPAGRIVWHDQNAQQLLDPPDGALLGAPLGDLVMGGAARTLLPGLLDASRSGREATAVLTLRVEGCGCPLDAHSPGPGIGRNG